MYCDSNVKYHLLFIISVLIISISGTVNGKAICNTTGENIYIQFRNDRQKYIVSILNKYQSIYQLKLYYCTVNDFLDLIKVKGLITVSKVKIQASSILQTAIYIKKNNDNGWFNSTKELTITNSSINLFNISINLPLTYLDLSDNKINTFNCSNENIPKLSYLNLSYNPLSSFFYIPNTGIQSNNASIILSNLNDTLKSVMISVQTDILDLHDNQSSDLVFLKVTATVNHINLSYNLFDRLSIFINYPYLQNVGFLDLANNPFICNRTLTYHMLSLEADGKIDPKSIYCKFQNQSTKKRYPVNEYGMFLNNELMANEYTDAKLLKESLEILKQLNLTIKYESYNLYIQWTYPQNTNPNTYMNFRIYNSLLQSIYTNQTSINQSSVTLPLKETYIIVCITVSIKEHDEPPQDQLKSILGRCSSFKLESPTTTRPPFIIPYPNYYVYGLIGILALYIVLTIYPIFVCMSQCMNKRRMRNRKYSNSVPNPPQSSRSVISNQTSVVSLDGNMGKIAPIEYDYTDLGSTNLSVTYGDIPMTQTNVLDTYVYTDSSEKDGFSKNSISHYPKGNTNMTYLGMDDESNLYDSTIPSGNNEYQDMNQVNKTKI